MIHCTTLSGTEGTCGIQRTQRSIPSSGFCIRETHSESQRILADLGCRNIDRLLAIWQGLHPDSYVESHVNPRATFTTPPYSRADENTRTYFKSNILLTHTDLDSFTPIPS
jgi:hypothetical protein